MTSWVTPCMVCRHARGYKCKAYPDGIPSPIFAGEETHFTPRAGDHGVVYEPDEGPEAAALIKQLLPIFGERMSAVGHGDEAEEPAEP